MEDLLDTFYFFLLSTCGRDIGQSSPQKTRLARTKPPPTKLGTRQSSHLHRRVTRSLRTMGPPSQLCTRQRNHQDPGPSACPPMQQRRVQLNPQKIRPPGSLKNMKPPTELCTAQMRTLDTRLRESPLKRSPPT